MSTPINVQIASDFIAFNKESTSEYHCTAEAVKLLDSAGFVELKEREKWSISPQGKYYVVRNQSSVLAFGLGGQWTPESPMIGSFAHVDSPCLKLKPISKLDCKDIMQIGIQTYGGLLLHTWFDRDLSVAGRVLVNRDGKIVPELLCIKDPILRIPNLAIHLDRTVSTDGFKPNPEANTAPVLATILAELGFESAGDNIDPSVFKHPGENAKANCTGNKPCGTTAAEKLSAKFQVKHHSAFLARVAAELSVDVNQIVDFDLSLYDTQAPAFNGLYKEFIVARGLDNQLMSFISTRALIDATNDTELFSKNKSLIMAGLFNHEEIGSASTTGADGNFFMSVLNRVYKETLPQAAARSLLISSDMAHAIHPNYASKHEGKHQPKMGAGLVVKTNCNQRYATSSESALPVTLTAAKHDIPLQDFVVANGVACGSTVGPFLATASGMRTVDVGCPQWAMHSIRETCHVLDVESSHRLFVALFNEYDQVEEQIQF
jgi:aspartyl aminopeptidase